MARPRKQSNTREESMAAEGFESLDAVSEEDTFEETMRSRGYDSMSAGSFRRGQMPLSDEVADII